MEAQANRSTWERRGVDLGHGTIVDGRRAEQLYLEVWSVSRQLLFGS